MDKIIVRLTNLTILGRGWDAGIQRDPHDPEWSSVCDAVENGTYIHHGRGGSVVCEMTSSQAERLRKDLLDNAEIYRSQEGDKECQKWSYAFSHDANRIQRQLENALAQPSLV